MTVQYYVVFMINYLNLAGQDRHMSFSDQEWKKLKEIIEKACDEELAPPLDPADVSIGGVLGEYLTKVSSEICLECDYVDEHDFYASDATPRVIMLSSLGCTSRYFMSIPEEKVVYVELDSRRYPTEKDSCNPTLNYVNEKGEPLSDMIRGILTAEST